MPDRSTFHVRCLCGHEIVSTTREATCPHCGRGAVLDWGNWGEESDAVRIDAKLDAMKREKRDHLRPSRKPNGGAEDELVSVLF
jgi:endogenous inhibitor of DNA gyrase (YacG/DUF329 family)